MVRSLAILCVALACTGCYTLKGPRVKRPPMTQQNYANVDSTRRPPEGTTYKYFRNQGRGANGELKESTIRAMFQSKTP